MQDLGCAYVALSIDMVGFQTLRKALLCAGARRSDPDRMGPLCTRRVCALGHGGRGR